MHSFKKIGINTGAQLFIKLLSSLTTVIAAFFISRILGFGTFGSFTKITTFISFFYLISDFGLNTVFLQKYHTDPEQQFGNFLVLRILFSVVLTAIAVGIGFLLPYSSQFQTGYSMFEKLGILVYSLTIITYAVTLSLTVFLQKRLSYERSIIPNLTSSIVFFALFIVGMMQHNLFTILASFVLQGIVLCFHLYTTVHKKNSQLSTTGFSLFSKQLLVLSFPLAFMLFLNLIYAKADTILLSFMKPSYDVGVYGFSYRIFEFLIAVPAFFSNSVYPILLDTQNDSRVFLTLMRKYTGVLFVLSLAISILGFFLSPVIGIVFPQFLPTVQPLQVLILSLPLFFITSLFQWFFIIRNKLKFLITLYAGTMILNIVLNYLFIPQFSYHASALITLITEGIVFVGMIGYLVLREPNFFRNTL